MRRELGHENYHLAITDNNGRGVVCGCFCEYTNISHSAFVAKLQ